jgi:acyl-CoA reductase-like NAD-dependent aldehyde dehydrogenase
MPRLPVIKTFKLFIGGQFPRSESGRSRPVHARGGAGGGRPQRVLAHVSWASRKDLRDAVEAARGGAARWSEATAALRGAVLYRMAEMLEERSADFARVIAGTCPGGVRAARREVAASVDRLVAFAGWTDKFAQVLGCQNPVAGPYYDFTTPEPTGIVGLVAPDEPPLLGAVSLLAPPLCAGNAVVLLASDAHPLPAVLLAEVCATSDLPAGALNILTGRRDELLEPLAQHREVNAVGAANLAAAQARVLRLGCAANLKRVHLSTCGPAEWFDDSRHESPWTIEPFVEMKTIWHPSAT